MITGRYLRLPTTLGLAFMLALGAVSAWSPALAVEMNSLYTVQVPFDSGDPNGQNAAYARALGELLIRVTGREAAAESEDVSGLFPTPGHYVLQYRHGDNDSLVVTFDGPAIEALLRRAGQPVWGHDRPLTIVWLAVDWGMGEREIVGADDADTTPDVTRSIDRNRLLRERVLASAERRGIPIMFPLLDTEDLESVSFSDIWGGFDDALLDASRRYGTSSVLVGRVRGGELFRNRWSYYFGGQRLAWTGGPETVVNLLADSLAEQFAYAGDAPVETVVLTISGVDSVSAYGTVQRFLADLSVIDGYRVDTVTGGDIRFQVQVQGGSERLASALEFSGILQRGDWLGAQDFFGAQNTSESLDYVYRPYSPDRIGLDDGLSVEDPDEPSAADNN